MIGKRLSELLTGYGFRVIAQDPFLSDEQAMEIGVEKVSLEELFSRAYIVSNHIPDLPSTKKVLDRALFDSMREGAIFTNRSGQRGLFSRVKKFGFWMGSC